MQPQEGQGSDAADSDGAQFPWTTLRSSCTGLTLWVLKSELGVHWESEALTMAFTAGMVFSGEGEAAMVPPPFSVIDKWPQQLRDTSVLLSFPNTGLRLGVGRSGGETPL